MNKTLRVSKAKGRREFLLAEPGRARCKECGATYHYPICAVPLLEFVTDVFRFYQAHERCGAEDSSVLV
jgi:hypothetical protein